MFRKAAALLGRRRGIREADASPNANNCAGVFVSDLTPAFTATAPPSFGQSRSELGRSGLTGETEKAATEALASCGTP